MARGWFQFVRTPLEPDPEAVVRRNLARRESNFLNLVRQVIFENPANPYRRLFEWAGCAYADLEQAINNDGLEATLE